MGSMAEGRIFLARDSLEADMRKQDRIRQQETQDSSKQQPERPQPRDSEKAKGSASGEQPNKPPRQPGALPLPD
jgi:hypothetical protein